MTISEAQRFRQEVAGRLQVGRRPPALAWLQPASAHLALLPAVRASSARLAAHPDTRLRPLCPPPQNPDTRGVRGKINTFGFSSQALERAGVDPGSPACSYPFVIIASTDVNQVRRPGGAGALLGA
jgi:hypothetical protein